MSSLHVTTLQVSIHAFRGEGDDVDVDLAFERVAFQSTPSGGKATVPFDFDRCDHWVSIHAFRGEGDPPHRSLVQQRGVSIHAFRGEGDRSAPRSLRILNGFNPRLPGGRRRYASAPKTYARMFQSTPSGGKATRRLGRYRRDRGVSIHAFRGEGDRNI